MSEKFDPYYRWLGIPPKDQPPNHYRLLSLDLFEPDPSVIEAAADRQMGHLRTYQTGKYGPLSQKLLNEVAAAKICLLNPAKKADYDARLHAQLGQPPAVHREGAALDPNVAGAIEQAAFGPSVRTYRAAKRRRSNPAVLLGLLTAGVLGLAAAVGFLAWRQFGPGAASRRDLRSQEVARSGDRPQPVRRGSPDPDAHPTEGLPAPAGDLRSQDVARSGDRPQPKPNKIAEPSPKPDAPEPPTSPKPGPQPPAKPETPPEPKKASIPSEAEQEKARKLVRDVYKDQMTAAKDAALQTALAKKLIADAVQTKDDLPGQYAMLMEAQDWAQAAQDAETALQAVETLAGWFEVDALAMKSEVLQRWAKPLKTPGDHAMAAAKLLALGEEAAAEDRFALVEELGKQAAAEANRSRDKDLAAEVKAQRQEWQEAAERFAAIAEARETLKTKPDEPEANLAVGKYLCFVKGDWDDGLPKLALGSDEALKSPAAKDRAGPATAVDQAQVARDWWELAKNEEEPARSQLRQRAAYWYRRAFPGLQGLPAEEAKTRIQEVDAEEQAEAGPPGSAKTLGKTAFKIPRTPAASARPMQFQIVARIDGQDELQLYRAEAKWVHHTGQWPLGVIVNNLPWAPQAMPTRPYDRAGRARFRDVDFQSAQLQKIRGRGTVTLQKADDHLTITFNDPASGNDLYVLTITLKRAPKGTGVRD